MGCSDNHRNGFCGFKKIKISGYPRGHPPKGDEIERNYAVTSVDQKELHDAIEKGGAQDNLNEKYLHFRRINKAYPVESRNIEKDTEQKKKGKRKRESYKNSNCNVHKKNVDIKKKYKGKDQRKEGNEKGVKSANGTHLCLTFL